MSRDQRDQPLQQQQQQLPQQQQQQQHPQQQQQPLSAMYSHRASTKQQALALLLVHLPKYIRIGDSLVLSPHATTRITRKDHHFHTHLHTLLHSLTHPRTHPTSCQHTSYQPTSISASPIRAIPIHLMLSSIDPLSLCGSAMDLHADAAVSRMEDTTVSPFPPSTQQQPQQQQQQQSDDYGR